MRSRRGFSRILAGILLAAALGTPRTEAKGPSAGTSEGSGPAVRMEELEVRGFREDPGLLFVPAPSGVPVPPLGRIDSLVGELGRPVPPWEIRDGIHLRKGGESSYEGID